MARRNTAPKAALPTASAVKREAVLSAAQDLFLESGFAATSMDAVAQRANVSKATLYAHFTSKTELFAALIRGRCEQCFGTIDIPDAVGGPEAGLRTIALRFLDLVLSPEALGMYRVVIAEAPRLPEVGEAFHTAGPSAGLCGISGYFAELDRLGLLEVPDPDLAAELFTGMLKSDLHSRRLLGLPGGRPVDEMAEAAVKMVVAAYRPNAKPSKP